MNTLGRDLFGILLTSFLGGCLRVSIAVLRPPGKVGCDLSAQPPTQLLAEQRVKNVSNIPIFFFKRGCFLNGKERYY
jgi:hypothetical protein